MADALVRKGMVASRDEAFADILSSRSRYYVGHYAIDARRAVRLVSDAGGVAVMAHPLAHRRGRVVSDEVDRRAGRRRAGRHRGRTTPTTTRPTSGTPRHWPSGSAC